MNSVEVYIFEDAEGTPDTFTTTNATEAREYAQRAEVLSEDLLKR